MAPALPTAAAPTAAIPMLAPVYMQPVVYVMPQQVVYAAPAQLPVASTATAPTTTPTTTPTVMPAASTSTTPATSGGGAVDGAAGGAQQVGQVPGELTSVLQSLVQMLTQLVQLVQASLAQHATTSGGGTPPSMPGCSHMGKTASTESKDDPESTTTPDQPDPPKAPPSNAARDARGGVLLIGDSLTVGAKRYFTSKLAGQPVEVDATSGISLKEGMRRYNAHTVKPRVVEMALFTNNSPSQLADLHAAIQKTVDDARARGGRVVWATIVRPGSYDATNQMIRDMAARNADVMGLVDWRAMIDQHPEWLAKDGVHSNAAGYAARAQAFADAARA